MFEAALIELYATLGTTYNLVSDDYFDILVVNIRCYRVLKEKESPSQTFVTENYKFRQNRSEY